MVKYIKVCKGWYDTTEFHVMEVCLSCKYVYDTLTTKCVYKMLENFGNSQLEKGQS